MDALPSAADEEKDGLLQRGLDWIGRNKEALGALNSVILTWLKSWQ